MLVLLCVRSLSCLLMLLLLLLLLEALPTCFLFAVFLLAVFFTLFFFTLFLGAILPAAAGSLCCAFQMSSPARATKW